MIPAVYVAFLILFLLVMALSGNSCPFIYTYNGQDFVFAGEIYSGAIYPPLERHDYLYLPDLVEDNGLYKLKIANQLEEEQHTNLLELLVFDHAADTDILVGKYGNLHAISNVNKPVPALNLAGDDVLPMVEKEDDLIYIGHDPSRDPPLLDGVILAFEKPQTTEKVDLGGTGDGPIRIKLEASSYFWEIGYVGLNQTPESKTSSRPIQLSEASNEKGESVKEELLLNDEKYYIQPEIGNEAMLHFPVPEMSGEERTLILHSKGYYQILQDPKGLARIKDLKDIRKSGISLLKISFQTFRNPYQAIKALSLLIRQRKRLHGNNRDHKIVKSGNLYYLEYIYPRISFGRF